MIQENIQLIVIDFLCGAGGVTSGFENAIIDGAKVAKVIAGLNHDEVAIDSHANNFIHVKHFIKDLRDISFDELRKLIDFYKKLYPNAKIAFWFSLECTNFSKAKGGLPRDADSRTLAEELIFKKNPKTGKKNLPGYVPALEPDYVMIENVEEFMSWGPLDEHGKPVSKRNGSDYVKWCNKIQGFGYRFDYRILNSADFGAFTSRKRYFAIFAKGDLPIAWPEPTHAKNPEKEGMFGKLQKWKAVRDVLDLEDVGNSIFGRKKALSEKTLARIYAGLIKFVAGGKDQFLVKYNSMNKNGGYAAPDMDSPAPVIPTRNMLYLASPEFLFASYGGKHVGKLYPSSAPSTTITTSDNKKLVQPVFMVQRNSGTPESKVCSSDNPSRTITGTGGNLNVVQPAFITKYFSGNPDHMNIPVTGPAGTIRCIDGQALVQPRYLIHYYSNGGEISGLDNISPTLRCTAGDALITPQQFMMRDFSNGGSEKSIDHPAGSVMPCPKMNLVSPEPFIMDTQFNNTGSEIGSPLPVITANRKYHYLLNPQWAINSGAGLEGPSPVLIARMDKSPLYLVTTEEGFLAVEVFETDSEYTKKIKEFMALYGIVDIKMRMLKVSELLKIQGFPDGYILKGTQADQKKFIGNSVVPLVAQRMAEALAGKLMTPKTKAA